MPIVKPFRTTIRHASADAVPQALKRNAPRNELGKMRSRNGVLFTFRNHIPPQHYCPVLNLYIGVDTAQLHLLSDGCRMRVKCDEIGVRYWYDDDTGKRVSGTRKRECEKLMASFWRKDDGNA